MPKRIYPSIECYDSSCPWDAPESENVCMLLSEERQEVNFETIARKRWTQRHYAMVFARTGERRMMCWYFGKNWLIGSALRVKNMPV